MDQKVISRPPKQWDSQFRKSSNAFCCRFDFRNSSTFPFSLIGDRDPSGLHVPYKGVTLAFASRQQWTSAGLPQKRKLALPSKASKLQRTNTFIPIVSAEMLAGVAARRWTGVMGWPVTTWNTVATDDTVLAGKA